MKPQQMILAEMKKTPFFYEGGDEEEVRGRVEAMLKKGCQSEASLDAAREVVEVVMTKHNKASIFAEALKRLHEVEQRYGAQVPNHKYHSVHQVYTFLLGLLAYRRIKVLRRLLDAEMTSTADQPSGGSAEGEFLFRWRVCAFLHDVGNGVSMHGQKQPRRRKLIGEFLSDFFDERGGTSTHEVVDIDALARGKSGTALLDAVEGGDRISRLGAALLRAPTYGDILYDHGVVSALMTLRALDNLYVDKLNEGIEVKDGVSYARCHFDQSIVRATHAIAIHNVDQHGEIADEVWGTRSVYGGEDRWLAFLLKVCDLIQIWHKPDVQTGKTVEDGDVDIEVTGDAIVVKRLGPPDKSAKLWKQLGSVMREYVHPSARRFVRLACEQA